MRLARLLPIAAIVLAALGGCGKGGSAGSGSGNGSNGAASANGSNGSANGSNGSANGSANGSGSPSGGSGSGSAAPAAYRTAASKPILDPKVVGTGKTFMVASEGPDATRVGKEILAKGGNAVDAAVAVGFALAVTHQTAGNIGGGGFAVVRIGPGKFETLDFRETAPAKATTTMYLDDAGNVTKDSLWSHRASGIPGSVAGLYELHKKHGKLPWKDLVAPSIALARDGFAIDHYQGEAVERVKDKLAKIPATAAIWMPNGVAVKEGDTLKIPDLAATLERIAAQGSDGFYKGKTAELIVDEMKRGGGIITAEDLAGYKVEWREPLTFQYRGNTIVSMPPPSSGGIVLAMTANILGKVELSKLPWHGVEHVHWVVEAWRRGFAARNELLGDPKFVDNPTAKLVSKEYTDKLVATITDNATVSKGLALPPVEGIHTTNFVVVDNKGMAVAITTTINTTFGSLVTIGGAGFIMNNEMDDFASKPGVPNVFGLVQGKANQIEPGKRMLSSMSPTLVEDSKHELVLALGARGGPRIITQVWQALSNVIDFGMSAPDAVAAQRFHSQHLPDVVRLEAESIDADTEAALAKRGYKYEWGDARTSGSTTMIARTKDGWSGTADPRNGGAAMGD